MIEHTPWIGPLYQREGIGGQRLAIMGYSCWVCLDDPGYTVNSIERVIDGSWSNVRFYNDIARYFGMTPAAFYQRVVMFEFVPCSIGGSDAKYASATPAQAELGRERTLRIARDCKVDKLLVFSRKAWRSMPPTVEHMEKRRALLGDTNFEVGHYWLNDRNVTAIGLRHPQYAPRPLMTRAAQLCLALPEGP